MQLEILDLFLMNFILHPQEHRKKNLQAYTNRFEF